jgi:hypothetical protein
VPYLVRIWPNPSRHCRATSLPSSRRTGDSRTNSSLGGGSPAYTTAAGEAPRAGASLDAVPTTIEDRPSRLPVASFLWFVSTVVSRQIGFVSSCRSRRKKHCHKWCNVACLWVLSSRWPRHPVVLFGRTEPRLKESSRAVGSWMDDRD